MIFCWEKFQLLKWKHDKWVMLIVSVEGWVLKEVVGEYDEDVCKFLLELEEPSFLCLKISDGLFGLIFGVTWFRFICEDCGGGSSMVCAL